MVVDFGFFSQVSFLLLQTQIIIIIFVHEKIADFKMSVNNYKYGCPFV